MILIGGGAVCAILALSAAKLPPALANAGGLWEISRSATGAGAEKVCAPDLAVLAQWEHRRGQCTRVVISSTTDEAVIHYTCSGGGFGRSNIKALTPRSLRIDTQGISSGYPFSYVLHARKVGNCTAALRPRLTKTRY